MTNSQVWIWMGGGIIALLFVLNTMNKQQPAVFDNSYATTVADSMITKCGYQVGDTSENQKMCMITDLKGGDTVDDCWLLIKNFNEITMQNKEVINCYLTVSYNDEKAID